MSTLSLDKELQERLREAAALGDLDEVRTLVDSGVNVNSQNEINGWTCLHWACKRNHKAVVAFLLNSGADKGILTSKGELAVQLTSKPDIRRLLGVEEDVPEVKEPELPIIPNYLSNPQFPYGKTDTDDLILASHLFQNGTANQEPYCEPAASSPSQPGPSPAALLACEQEHNLFASTEVPKEGARVPAVEQNGLMLDPQGAVNGTLSEVLLSRNGECAHGVSPKEPVCSVPASSQSAHPSVSRQQSIPQQLNCPQPGVSVPAFQPFFFTSTFPVNVQELVLKVRIQNLNARENDFIEVELDRQELTYRSLLRVCCRELGISADHDKDVARLQDFQELEVVLERMEGLSLLSGVGHGSLTDRPCYNMKASKLTY
ncbi:ankyrin repeat domain-containing protein 40-like [Scleropages formosus]|uniref:Ankyrin repeat domain-containing protein 40-like n=1 Tax=Scleropages formosus TaxID=113540 RepID=A0A0P7VPM8_SCLFO|nr:ankyrin repeat domain-containing protein 40-like [Scleropages formosus]